MWHGQRTPDGTPDQDHWGRRCSRDGGVPGGGRLVADREDPPLAQDLCRPAADGPGRVDEVDAAGVIAEEPLGVTGVNAGEDGAQGRDSPVHVALTESAYPPGQGCTYVDCRFPEVPAAVLRREVDVGIWHPQSQRHPPRSGRSQLHGPGGHRDERGLEHAVRRCPGGVAVPGRAQVGPGCAAAGNSRGRSAGTVPGRPALTRAALGRGWPSVAARLGNRPPSTSFSKRPSVAAGRLVGASLFQGARPASDCAGPGVDAYAKRPAGQLLDVAADGVGHRGTITRTGVIRSATCATTSNGSVE